MERSPLSTIELAARAAGGPGVRAARQDLETLAFVRGRAAESDFLASVCTGALLIASAGLLDGKLATTHKDALGELRRHRGVRVVKKRLVEDGRTITSAGVTAGIDLALRLVEGSLDAWRRRWSTVCRPRVDGSRPRSRRGSTLRSGAAYPPKMGGAEVLGKGGASHVRGAAPPTLK